MVSRTTRAHGTWRNPLPRRYVWPTPKAKVRYGWLYERGGEQRIGQLSSLDLGPQATMIEMGWTPLLKVRVRFKDGR